MGTIEKNGRKSSKVFLAPTETVSAKEDAPAEMVQITIFQAPYSSLVEHGLLLKMHEITQPVLDYVPAEYYLPVFRGEIDCPDGLPSDPDARANAILEQVFYIFNENRPAQYCGRSLSVGDVVMLEDQYYLCCVLGFTPVTFETGKTEFTGKQDPPFCQLKLPSGLVIRATAFKQSEYPSINIDLISETGSSEQLCFVEHNPEKEPGQELHIGVYCSSEDDPVYYGSYYKGSREGQE